MPSQRHRFEPFAANIANVAQTRRDTAKSSANVLGAPRFWYLPRSVLGYHHGNALDYALFQPIDGQRQFSFGGLQKRIRLVCKSYI
jgi:hypothetical protein